MRPLSPDGTVSVRCSLARVGGRIVRRRPRAWGWLGLVVMLIGWLSSAAAHADPRERMRTIETEHFFIHYFVGDEELADRAAALAERAYDNVTMALGHEPAIKTHIILNDRTDISNGSANAIPFPRIRLFASAPGPKTVLGAYDDWLDILITHEFTHVVHIDTVHGAPRVLNTVLGFGELGKTAAPNIVQPRWMVEGLATYAESELLSQGRYRSAIFDMTLRMAVLEQRFLGIDQVSSGARVFPYGTSVYLYGLHLLHYVATQYGEDKLAEMSHLYGGRPVPMGLNRVLADVIGVDFEQVWTEFRRSTERRFHAQARQIRARGLRQGTRLTVGTAEEAGDEHTRFPAWSPDDRYLYYYADDGHTDAGIRRISSAGAPLREGVGIGNQGQQLGVERVLTVEGPTRVSFVGASSELVFEEVGYHDQRYRWNDLYRWRGDDPAQREQLTVGKRAREPDVSPDGRTAVFVRNDLGQSRLGFVDLATREVTEVAPLERFVQVSSPRFAPDGRFVAYSSWRPGGYRDIMLYDRDRGTHRRVTASRHIDGAPAFSPDGRYLLFTSDRTGVFNVHAYDLVADRFYQVTNVLGGAFEPVLSHDGKRLAYVGYTSSGYDLWVMPFDPARFLPALPAADSLPVAPDPHYQPASWQGRVPSEQARRYQAFRTLYPRSILPTSFEWESIGSLTQAGLTTQLQDVLEFHTFTGAFRMQTGRPTGSLYYHYRRRYGAVRAGFGRSFAERDGYPRYIYDQPAGMFPDDGYFQTRYEERVTRVLGEYSLPLIRPQDDDFELQANVGYTFSRYEDVDVAQAPVDPNAPVTAAPEIGDVAELSIELGARGAKDARFTFGRKWGRTSGLRLAVLDHRLGGDFSDLQAVASHVEYVPMPWRGNHVLAARLVGGASAGGLARRGAFAIGGFPERQDVIRRAVERSAFSQAGVLRGYPRGLFVGSYYAVLNLEYRLPVVDVDRGVGFVPLFMRSVTLAGFSDWGYAWTGRLERKSIVGSLGASLIFALAIGFGERIDLVLQYAQGLDDEHGITYLRAMMARTF